MTTLIKRDSVARLMLGDLSVAGQNTVPRFTDGEAASAMEAAAIRLGVTLDGGQRKALRAFQGVVL